MKDVCTLVKKIVNEYFKKKISETKIKKNSIFGSIPILDKVVMIFTLIWLFDPSNIMEKIGKSMPIENASRKLFTTINRKI